MKYFLRLILLSALLLLSDLTFAQEVKYSGGSGGGYSSSSYYQFYAPAAFTATETGVQTITLTWVQNGTGDSVLVAYNTTNTFGTPVDGTTYTASEVISGGGTVTVIDSSSSVTHTFLAGGTTYYYKVWSLNSNKYSSGNTANGSITLSSSAILGRYSGGGGAGYGSSETGATPLPVELTGFTASVKGNNVLLNWQTATEINNYGFDIYRRVQNNRIDTEEDKSINTDDEWETIGFVEGAGNSNSPKNYSFNDSPTGGNKFQYRLKQIDTDGAFSYSDIVKINLLLATNFELFQNYPNPFNPATEIKFGLPKASRVILIIYNALGEVVETLINKEMDAGIYNINFNAGKFASGFYIYRMHTDDLVLTKKMLLIK